LLARRLLTYPFKADRCCTAEFQLARYLIMKESDIMGVLLETERHKKAA
jgi:hypothetical protein